MTRDMDFSWKALILAPLPIPLIYGVLLAISFPGKNPFAAFLFFSAPGTVLSYGITIFLFLPCLFVVSRFTSLTASLTGLLGTALGVIVYVPVIWTSYKSSGDDSGPPQITFGEYLRQHAFEWDFWFLAKPASRKNYQPTA